MEACASILTVLTVAFSVTKSINEALAAIKDGPEIIQFLKGDTSQLQSVLQKLSHISISSISGTDRLELIDLVKKCEDDLVDLNKRLSSLDVSGCDGRRGRLWGRLKLCLKERDLHQIRHVIRGHVQLLTLRLGLIQAQQSSLTVTQSTEMLGSLQELQQAVGALKLSETPSNNGNTDLPCPEASVTETDASTSSVLQGSILDGSITRLMRLLETKPRIVDMDEMAYLARDLEHLTISVGREFMQSNGDKRMQGAHLDVSTELKRMQGLIASSPSMMINKSEPAVILELAVPGSVLWQERKRKVIDTDDYTIMMTTVKRRQTLLSPGSWQTDQPRKEFLATVAFAGDASLHIRDTRGWSLLHCAIGNLPMLKFLIQQGLDVNEIPNDGSNHQMSPLHIANALRVDKENSVALLQAGADPTMETPGFVSWVRILAIKTQTQDKDFFQQVLCTNPFVSSDHEVINSLSLINCLCSRWTTTPPEYFDPDRERKLLDLLFERGHKFDFGKDCEEFAFGDRLLLSKVAERRDLLVYMLQRGRTDQGLPERSYLSSHAYRMCKPCSMSKSSLWGDFWDTIFDRAGYDILSCRNGHPRQARYGDGYTRQTFEELWQGREEHCPYWDDKLWPEFPTPEAQEAYELVLAGETCLMCRPCQEVEGWDCCHCGVCLLVFQFFCTDIHGHLHNWRCPRSRVGYWECLDDTGFYSFRPKAATDPDLIEGELIGFEDDLYHFSEIPDMDFESENGEDFPETQQAEVACLSHEEEDFSESLDRVERFQFEGHGELYENPWVYDDLLTLASGT
ncbi:hypothetical protein NW768_010820 [Fusarium equiseti]|uniref:Azaphilone pigments biosynthesis cluster protein L N-terminal domain-containing protein n=1 Tax=Fusarium equiseti TaxID=61235 RepID=A0ABQ8QZR9_FUSEQ|nr:hypothetical protein NW768_010820 [Fusarium equiseti]